MIDNRSPVVQAANFHLEKVRFQQQFESIFSPCFSQILITGNARQQIGTRMETRRIVFALEEKEKNRKVLVIGSSLGLRLMNIPVIFKIRCYIVHYIAN